MSNTFTTAGFTLSLAELGLKETSVNASLAYLIQYGLNKSVSDAGALGKDAKLPSGKTREEHIQDLRKARFEAIQAGTMGTTHRGPRLRGYEAILAQVTWDLLAAAKAKADPKWVKAKVPSGVMRIQIAEYWAKPRKSQEEVTLKAQKLFEAQSSTQVSEEDLDDILG
jgi:hypothetical protein